MSDVINGVPRELLERSAQMIQFYVEYLCATNSEESDIELSGECADQLRALLAAQPQASAEIPFAGFDPNFCPGSNPDNPQTEEEEPEQAIAAQSAPDEREALQRLLDDVRDVRNADDVAFGWHEAAEQLGAAWQRAQSAPAGFDFTIEDRGECRVLVWSGNNGCRPASDEECTMWDAITAWQRAQSAPAGAVEGLRLAAEWHREQREAFNKQMEQDRENYEQGKAEDLRPERLEALLSRWATSSAQAANHGDYAAELERQANALAAHQPAARQEQGDDKARLDFLEKNPNWLGYSKGRYRCVRPGTNYSYPVFRTAREAIDAALSASAEGK